MLLSVAVKRSPPVLVARDELPVLGEHEDGRFRESELLLGGEPRADDHVGADLRPPPIPRMHEVGDGHVAPVVIVVAAAVVGFGGTVVGDNGPNGAGRNRRKPEELLDDAMPLYPVQETGVDIAVGDYQ